MPYLSTENWISLIGMLIGLWAVYSSNRKTRNHATQQTAVQQALLTEWQKQRAEIDVEQDKRIKEIENGIGTLTQAQNKQANEITLIQRENSATLDLLKKIEHSLEDLKPIPTEIKYIKEIFEKELNNLKRPY